MTPAQRHSAILAGLRLLERALDEYDGPGAPDRMARSLAGLGGILTNEGAHEAPDPREIDALCEELNTWQPYSVVYARDEEPPNITGLIWRSSGEENPRSRLLSTVQVDGCPMHLEAYAVAYLGEEQTFSGDYHDVPEQVYEAVGGEGAWNTVLIEDREYVLIATPFCQ